MLPYVNELKLAERAKLVHALKQLSQADPVCQTVVQDNGELNLLAAGELHLEVSGYSLLGLDLTMCQQRCLRDLAETFGRVEMVVSDPIIPFKETIIPSLDEWEKPATESTTACKQGVLKIRAVATPKPIAKFIDDHPTFMLAITSEASR